VQVIGRISDWKDPQYESAAQYLSQKLNTMVFEEKDVDFSGAWVFGVFDQGTNLFHARLNVSLGDEKDTVTVVHPEWAIANGYKPGKDGFDGFDIRNADDLTKKFGMKFYDQADKAETNFIVLKDPVAARPLPSRLATASASTSQPSRPAPKLRMIQRVRNHFGIGFASSAWTVRRKFPIPLPWMMRTCRIAPLLARRQIILHQVLHLARLERVQSKHAVDRLLDWPVLVHDPLSPRNVARQAAPPSAPGAHAPRESGSAPPLNPPRSGGSPSIHFCPLPLPNTPYSSTPFSAYPHPLCARAAGHNSGEKTFCSNQAHLSAFK